MSKRGNPLEWVTDVMKAVASTDVTAAEAPKNGRIQLLLDRDEVADIEKIYVIIKPQYYQVPDFANDEMRVWGFCVSVDPRVDTPFILPANIVNLEDRSVFFYGFTTVDNEMIATIANQQNVVVQGKEQVFEMMLGTPLTVGGDIGWLVGGTFEASTSNVDMMITVYFRRRKSSTEKANLIILRR